MKGAISIWAFASSLFLLLLGSSNLYAAGYVAKTFDCPGNRTLIPAGGRIEVTDLTISGTATHTVTVFFGPPRQNLVTAFVGNRAPFVSNFDGKIESAEEQSLKVECTGSGTVSVTTSGTRIGGV